MIIQIHMRLAKHDVSIINTLASNMAVIAIVGTHMGDMENAMLVIVAKNDALEIVL